MRRSRPRRARRTGRRPPRPRPAAPLRPRRRSRAPIWRSATRCRSATGVARRPSSPTPTTSSATRSWSPRSWAWRSSTRRARARRRRASWTPRRRATAARTACSRTPGTGRPIRCTSRTTRSTSRSSTSPVDTLEETEVDLVTVQIGANDAFICQRTTADRCSSQAELQTLAQTVQTNLDRILKALREQYDGQIVVVTYYALNYSDAFGRRHSCWAAGSPRSRRRTARTSPTGTRRSGRGRPRPAATRSRPGWCCRTTCTRRRRASGCSPTPSRRSSRDG